ncbi:MAG: glycosyltransferase family 4 protein [Candidatus Methylacidiphilales bacterium]|nr:glycosyltransferase family 4 protein [Candidatus Methylacidiphilales bacterium]
MALSYRDGIPEGMIMREVFYLFASKVSEKGLGLVVREQLRALSEARIRVTLMSRGGFEGNNIKPLTWRHTPANALSWLPSQTYYCAQFRFFSLMAAQHLRRHAGRYDACICWNRQGMALLPVAHTLGVKSFLNHPSWHHDYPPGASGWVDHAWPRFKRRDFDRQYELADRILVASAQAERTFQACGVPSDKIIPIGRGADLDEFTSPERAFRPFRVIMVGELGERKGVIEALEAWRYAALPEAEFWLVGHLPHETETRVRAVAAAMPSVKIMGYRKDVGHLMAQCHVQILPSRREGLAKSLIEGAACGLVTLATREAGLEIKEGDTGWYIKREAKQNNGELMRRLYADEPEWRRMSKLSTEDARANHTWTAFRRMFLKSIQEEVK